MSSEIIGALEQARRWRDAGLGVALATVVETWGSSPRPAGSRLAVNDESAFVGSVSGGCIEAAVVHEALRTIGDGAPRVLEFGVSHELAWEVGLACGGRVRVFVERVEPRRGLLDSLLEAWREKRPVVLATELASGAQQLIGKEAHAGVEAALLEAAQTALARDACRILRLGGRELFVQPFDLPLRLIVVGAVHISQSLAAMAPLAGYEVVVVDPRRDFASAERFPGVAVSSEWPDPALRALAPDRRTAVVTLTHDPKLDDPALEVALASDAFYVGSLGSRKTHAARLARLRRLGIPEAALARIHAPVGLAIGARSPAEIAVSILAEIIATLRGAP